MHRHANSIYSTAPRRLQWEDADVNTLINTYKMNVNQVVVWMTWGEETWEEETEEKVCACECHIILFSIGLSVITYTF